MLPPAAFSSDGDIPTGFHINANHGYLVGLVDQGACLVALVDDTITYPVVSDMYAYTVQTCSRPSIYVYSVRIGYSSTVYMPVVTNPVR